MIVRTISRFGIVLVTALSTAGLAIVAEARQPLIESYSAPGNLESPHKIGCIPLSGASREYNPVDLYRGARVCLASGRLQDAFPLVALANAYGRFDMLRVVDPTAHQAIIVAQMEIFAETPDAVKAQFSALAVKNMSDPTEHAELCRAVKSLGPPSYKPRYMVQHGVMAFMPRDGEGLAKDFDRDKAWSDVLTSYLKCD